MGLAVSVNIDEQKWNVTTRIMPCGGMKYFAAFCAPYLKLVRACKPDVVGQQKSILGNFFGRNTFSKIVTLIV